MHTHLYTFVVLAVLASCAKQASPEASPGEPPALAATLPDHMGLQCTLAETSRAAIIKGDLDGAREPMRGIADYQIIADAPPEWEPFVVRLKDSARSVVDAPDLTAASLALSEVGAACGQCHAKVGVGPGFIRPTAPGPGDTPEANMPRHRWQAEMLWYGLVAPSDDDWQAGIDAIRQDYWSSSAVATQDAVAAWLQEMAKAAPEARDFERRAQFHGAFLASCANCH